MNQRAGRVSWIAMVVVIAAALTIGAFGERSPRTEADRVRAVASGVRCPTCQGLSAAESDAIAAQAVRDAIRDGIRDGQTDAEIRAFLVSRYGDEILLKPRATGLASLVWMLPVAALLVAVFGLAVVFRRWRRERPLVATDDDRALVAEALQR